MSPYFNDNEQEFNVKMDLQEPAGLSDLSAGHVNALIHNFFMPNVMWQSNPSPQSHWEHIWKLKQILECQTYEDNNTVAISIDTYHLHDFWTNELVTQLCPAGPL